MNDFTHRVCAIDPALTCPQPSRRGVLMALAAPAVAALACVPGRAAADDALAAFDAAARREPWLRPLKGVSDATGDVHTPTLLQEGRWPDELRGRFHRNGPALFERGGRRYEHWFDGDGMVQQFSITGASGAPRIAHRGRLVRTAKLQRERAAGRFLVGAFGTRIAREAGAPIQGPDAFNTANTNALEHAGRVLAMWEGGSAHALDPSDLSTLGPVTWRDDLAQVPFSAHPKLDPHGHLWNIGTFGRRLVVWHVGPDGKLVDARVTSLPLPGAMVHDMAVTERHLVVPIPPLILDFAALQRGVGAAGAFRFDAAQPLRVLVMDKADLARQRIFELPPEMLFHVGNACECADGVVELSYVGSPDAGFLTGQAMAMMKGQTAADDIPSSLRVARMDLRSGRATVERFDDAVEFPRCDPRRVGRPTRWLLSPTGWRRDAPAGFFHALQLRDLHTGRTQRHDFGPGEVVEEHVVVPRPGREAELDAWLLGTSHDWRRGQTVLNLFDAAHLDEGPIARAWLPYALPYGFHGNFTAG